MDIELVLPTLHSGQRQIAKIRKRFTVLACGRRFGKSAFLIDTGTNALIDGQIIAHFSPTYKSGEEFWRGIKAQIPKVLIADIDNSTRRLELITGGILECWTLSTGAAQRVRGRHYHGVLIDEAAWIANLRDLWYETIRATLTDFRGWAVVASTPNGYDFFWEMYGRGQDPMYKSWASIRRPSSANPYLDQREIDEAQRELPEKSFNQEYLAEFLEDGGMVFRGVAKVATLKESRPQDHDGARIVGGLDWGKDNDFTVLVLFNAETEEMVKMERFHQIGWNVQRGRIKAVYDQWKPDVIWAEQNSAGDVNIEQMQAEGLPVRPFITTQPSKRRIIEGLSLAIERQEPKLLDDETLKLEMQSYSLKRLPGGGWKYEARPGMHDDIVMATAIAWNGVRYGSVHIEFA